MKIPLCLLFFTIGISDVVGAKQQEWPQFLGPNRNGASNDESFAKGWLAGKLQERWRIPIGEGFSGIVVEGEIACTMDSDGKDEFVVSLRTADGKENWRVRLGPSPRDVYGGFGPRVTPTIQGDMIYAVSAQGDLVALQKNTGRLQWKRTLAEDMGWRPPAEGTACSPLVFDNRVYLITGGAGGKAIAAFDASNGKTLWTSMDDRPSYSSPVRWDYQNTPQALFLTGANLFSVEPSSGKLIWKYPWTTYDFVNVATPLIIPPDRIFISSGYDQGAAMLRISKNENGSLAVTEVWRNREMKNHFNNSVFYEKTLYGFDNAILKAIDVNTGQTLWREKGFGTGSVILEGSYLLILSDAGELSCAKADPGKLTLQKKQPVLSGRSWTPPSLANGSLYLRNHKEIVRLSIQENR
jgi:outer membrane protein assembly factor BamB